MVGIKRKGQKGDQPGAEEATQLGDQSDTKARKREDSEISLQFSMWMVTETAPCETEKCEGKKRTSFER